MATYDMMVIHNALSWVSITGERLPMTTSTVVAWWRVIVVIACLAAAVIAPLVLNNNKSSLLSVNSASQQVLLLQVKLLQPSLVDQPIAKALQGLASIGLGIKNHHE